MRGVKGIVFIPLIFSVLWIIGNYLFILNHEQALTKLAVSILEDHKGQFLISNLLMFFPNILLSLLLWFYSKTRSPGYSELMYICLISIFFGLFPQLLIYRFYYSSLHSDLVQLPVLLFGFPFIYMVTMIIGYVIGILTAPLFRDKA